MSAADTLRQAAALLRQRASEATPGPWEESFSDHGDVQVYAVDQPEQSVCDAGQAGEDRGNDAAYIATVHPGVGLLLADLLDRAADYADHRIEELAVARAILGAAGRHPTPSETDGQPAGTDTVTP